MGVEDILKELKKRFPEVVLKEVRLDIFRGLKLGIDVSIYAFKYMAASRKEACKYLDVAKEDPQPHILRSYWLEKYHQMMLAFLECDITPIPVFDGPPFRLKQDTKEDRVKAYLEAEAKIKELRENIAMDPSNGKLVSALKSQIENHVGFANGDFKALEEMLRAMGLPVIMAEYEAEAVCARLVRLGLTAGVVSNDSDTLAHMGGVMISDVKRAYRREVPIHHCTCIIVSEVLRVLEMSPGQFVQFCMLLGNDYNDRIPGYGWVNALKQLRAHGSLEAVVEVLGKKLDLSRSRLSDPALRAEIRGYFVDELDCVPKHPLEVMFPRTANPDHSLQEAIHASGESLKATFTEVFSGYNRGRMLETADATIKILSEFNQRFAGLQEFRIKTSS